MTVLPAIKTINLTEVKKQLCLKKLSWFVRESWNVIEPAAKLVWNWHLDAMCEHIQSVLDGWMESQKTGCKPLIQNLLINVPPGSMKSRVMAVCTTPWMWLHCPSWRSIFFSSNPRVSLRDSVYCRDVIVSDWYQNLFKPQWTFADDQNAKGDYRNSVGGRRMAIGVGARLTGERGDFIGVDDPHDADEVKSDVIRQGVLDWWDQTACNRVNDLVTSCRIGIAQRLHDGDWPGHILKSGEWEHLCIRQEFLPGQLKQVPREVNGEKKLVWVDEPTAIGWKDPRTKEGELMFPARFPADILPSEKRRLGSSGYSAQHQQDPAAAEGNAFKRAWFQYYEDCGDHYKLYDRKNNVGIRHVLKSKCCKRFQTADFAFSTKETADYTAILTIDVTPEGEMILIHCLRQRLEDPDAERKLEENYNAWKPHYVAIENKQNGATILQRIGRHNRIRTRELKADTDKKTRASIAIIEMENGLIFHPMRAPWLEDFEQELLRFPNGEHDDQVDVLAYAAIEKGVRLPSLMGVGTVTGVAGARVG